MNFGSKEVRTELWRLHNSTEKPLVSLIEWNPGVLKKRPIITGISRIIVKLSQIEGMIYKIEDFIVLTIYVMLN